MSIFWPVVRWAIAGPARVGVNEIGVGGLEGVSVEVSVGVAEGEDVGVSLDVSVDVAEGEDVGVSLDMSVDVAEGEAVGVSVGIGSNVGVAVAGRVATIPCKPHEHNNRHNPANAETKRVLDLILHRLNWIGYPNVIATWFMVGVYLSIVIPSAAK